MRWRDWRRDPATPGPVAADLGPGWVRPRWLEHLEARRGSPPRTWTTIGIPGSDRVGLVDRSGLVAARRGLWSLDWWVGADDRWHFPSRETAVRQRLVDDAPVVETAMRVPGGDALHRAFAARAPGGGAEMLVVEVENASAVPFALAVAVRPYDPTDIATVERIVLQGNVVTVDGRAALVLPRPPSRAAGSTQAEGDVAAMVTSGAAGSDLHVDVRCHAGLATAAFLFPVAHGATVRFALPLPADTWSRGRRRPAPAPGDEVAVAARGLPGSDQVARGWKAHSDRGLRVVLPDQRLADAVAANQRFLLLFATSAAASVVGALDQWGYHAEADEARATRRRRPRRGAAPGVTAPAEGLEGSVGDTERTTRLALAELEAGDRRALDRLAGLLDVATTTWTWSQTTDARLAGGLSGEGHHAPTTAGFMTLVRNLLVRETGDGGLALCSLLPHGWRGQPVEVHDAPTRHGSLSYALRWHGDRPALLWELTPPAGRPPVRLTAPGLDPAWSSSEPKGDALLGPTPGPSAVGA